MGNFSSSETCDTHEYPGYDENNNSHCFGEGWITKPGIGQDEITRPALKEAYAQTLKMAETWQLKLPEEKAWWYLRWIYFEVQGDDLDSQARQEFLNQNYLPFLTEQQVEMKLVNHPQCWLVYLNSSIPGSIIARRWEGDGFKTRLLTINRFWLQHKYSLKQLMKQKGWTGSHCS